MEEYLISDLNPNVKWKLIDANLMQRCLFEGLPIEAWKQIVDCVQRFSISDGCDAEFKNNMKLLKKGLKKINMEYLQDGEKKAEHFWDIGLATLIEQIYAIEASDKKEHFTHQIETLEKIGVNTIALDTSIYHTGTILDIHTSHYSDEKKVIIDKVYTDGNFTIGNVGGYDWCFEINNLKDDNYYLYTTILNALKEKQVKLLGAKATLRNFQGIYPNKEEILEPRQPMVSFVNIDDEVLEQFLRNKKLYLEYMELLAKMYPQEAMNWQATKRRVKEVFK